MRKATQAILTLFGLAVFLPAAALAQQSQGQSQDSQSKPQTQSLAEAARKAREKKGEQKAKIFTNDNLPTKGTVNVVGAQPAQQAEADAQQGEQAQGQVEGQAQGQTQKPGADEQLWRGRFAEARKKLADAEKELDILQRELNLMNVQYYSDPQRTLNEELTRKSVNEHRAKIDAKQAEVNQLRQAIEDLERDLRAAGGPPGWSRP
jgi:hypothetical protein